MKPFCLSPFLLIACFKLVVAASKADAAESRAERTLVSATANILGKPGSGVLFPVETEDPFLAETPLGVFDDVAIEYVALDAPGRALTRESKPWPFVGHLSGAAGVAPLVWLTGRMKLNYLVFLPLLVSQSPVEAASFWDRRLNLDPEPTNEDASDGGKLEKGNRGPLGRKEVDERSGNQSLRHSVGTDANGTDKDTAKIHHENISNRMDTITSEEGTLDNKNDYGRILQECENEPEWKFSVADDSSSWAAFTNFTCEQLQGKFSEKGCNALSLAIPANGKKGVVEACCFCGGGTSALNKPCEDNYLWQKRGLDCTFLEENDLCNEFKEERLGPGKGITAAEACCACGGGYRTIKERVDPIDVCSINTHARRDLQDKHFVAGKATVGSKRAAAQTINWFNLEKPQGIPNLEFLGVGYNILEGNPRGSFSSEADPGLGYRVIKLVQDNKHTTNDGTYKIPHGAEVRYSHTCHYDDKSIEISSQRDYQERLSKEAKSDLNLSVKVDVGYLFWKTTIENSLAFSNSEKGKSFKDESIKEDKTTFEARAICTEYEAFFNPYAKLQLDATFERALEGLPCQYDEGDEEEKGMFIKFIKTYGTHYTKKVALGGKRVYSTSMSSRDYSSLVRQEVDVASTFSLAVQAALSYNQEEGETSSCTTVTKEGGTSVNVNVQQEQEASDDNNPLSASVETSFDLSKFTRDMRQAEALNKIRQKKLETTEVNIGGLPNIDWRDWATTVTDRPMPIYYELEPIWNLMGQKKAAAFINALYDLYGLSFEDGPETGLETFKFGVLRGSGLPISKYSSNPNSDYRALAELGSESVEITETEQTTENNVIADQTTNVLTTVQTYGLTWKGKVNRPIPFFATAINGNIAKDNLEEKMISTVKEMSDPTDKSNKGSFAYVFDIENNVPYTFSEDQISAGRMAITNSISNDNEIGKSFVTPPPSFSFLALEDFRDHDYVWGGVVSNEGVLIRSIGKGLEFHISIQNKKKDYFIKEFVVDAIGSEKIEHATILLFPNHFKQKSNYDEETKPDQFPRDVGQVSIGTLGWKPTKKGGRFTAIVGVMNDYSREAASVGFNFLIIATPENNRHIKHGTVDYRVDRLADDSNYGQHWSPKSHEIGLCHKSHRDSLHKTTLSGSNIIVPSAKQIQQDQYYQKIIGESGSLHVVFQHEFDDLPTVIVTPVYPNLFLPKFDDNVFEVPKCVVEHLSTKGCDVKCGIVKSGQLADRYTLSYNPISFSIVAIGPTSTVETESDECDNIENGSVDTVPVDTNSYELTDCGCPSSCTAEILNRMATDEFGTFACRDRIDYGISNLGFNEAQACLLVSNVFPDVCGQGCNPESCGNPESNPNLEISPESNPNPQPYPALSYQLKFMRSIQTWHPIDWIFIKENGKQVWPENGGNQRIDKTNPTWEVKTPMEEDIELFSTDVHWAAFTTVYEIFWGNPDDESTIELFGTFEVGEHDLNSSPDASWGVDSDDQWVITKSPPLAGEILYRPIVIGKNNIAVSYLFFIEYSNKPGVEFV